VVLCCGALRAQPGPAPEVVAKPLLVALPTLPLDDLSARLRETVLKTLPKKMVFETSDNWGHQAQIPSIQGVRLIHVMRNHGAWEKAVVVARDLPAHLRLHIGELYSAADDRIIFTVHLTTPAHVELQKEIWQNGVQVFAGKVRARFQLSADIAMEAIRDEAVAAEAPQRLGSMRITHATYSCKKFVAENVNGLGGDLGRIGGGALERNFKPWQPVVLGEFQKSIAASIQTAAADRDMRADLSTLLLQTAVARSAFLRAQTETVATQYPAIVPAAAPVPVQIFPCPLFLGSLMIEIPLAVHADARVPAPPDRSSREERSGFSEYSVHYEHSGHSGHANPSSSHPEPTHRK